MAPVFGTGCCCCVKGCINIELYCLSGSVTQAQYGWLPQLKC